MAQTEVTEKQPKKRSKAGIVLLIIFLLLAGGAGFLYYSICKAPLTLEDPVKVAASAPMSAEDRFRVSAADQTLQVKLDTADLWNLILAHTGENFLDIVNKELSPYGLTVSGCAIGMDGEGLRLDLELFYKENRLVAKVPCNLEVSGKHLSLSPAQVKLGVIPLPVEGLISGLKLEYDLDLPVLAEVSQVQFEKDILVLTGTMDMLELLPSEEILRTSAVFSETMQPLLDALQTPEGIGTVYAHLEQHPGDMEGLYRELFTLADAEVLADYLDSRFGLTQRFFPGIDFADVAAEHTAMSGQVAERNHILEQFFTNLASDYNEKKFQLSGGEFLFSEYAWQTKEPLQITQYSKEKYDALFEVLDPESVFLVLVDAEDGFIRKTSSFYRMCDENQKFTQEVDFNKTYILGCVIRSVDGDPFLMYETEVTLNNTYARDITLCPLTEEDVSALQVPETFGVWTDK